MKKILCFIIALVLISCASCSKVKTPDDSSIEQNTTESSNNDNSISNTSSPSEEKTDEESENDESTKSGVGVKENPGDDGYSWGPGQH